MASLSFQSGTLSKILRTQSESTLQKNKYYIVGSTLNEGALEQRPTVSQMASSIKHFFMKCGVEFIFIPLQLYIKQFFTKYSVVQQIPIT